jgi:Family of unknown function (DUF5946)
MGLQIDADFANCSECGALSRDGLTCEDRFHAILGLEREYPELAAMHFLTVAAYNIQHPAQFTPEAIAGLRKSFVDFLEGRIDIAGIRDRGHYFDGNRRVLRPALERHPVLVCWKTTTADVYNPFDNAATAARVKCWVDSVKSEIESGEA